MVLLRLDYHVANLSASLEISLPYQAIYYYLLDNLVSGPSFVPTVIAALHPSNRRRNRGLRVVPATCKGFLDLFTQI